MTESWQKDHTKRTRIIQITSLVLAGILIVAAVMLFVMSKKNNDITCEQIGTIGDHIYYPENLFLSGDIAKNRKKR